jgi:sulfonate transport system permease protein
MALIGAWQLASIIFVGQPHQTGSPLVPGWQVLATKGLRGLSNYWNGGWGVKSTQLGGKESYRGALLVIGANSLDTLLRLIAGMALGVLFGAGLGLAVSYSIWGRRLVALPAHVARTLPLLAMIPLFELWFGLSLSGILIFIAYGVGAIMFAGTVNAVSNVSRIYVDNARTLGASRREIYRSIIIPAIFPELRTSILLSLGVGWSVVLGAEFLGAQTGLGYMIVQSQAFGLIDRMTVVAILIVIYAALTTVLFQRLTRPLVAWMPRSQRRT